MDEELLTAGEASRRLRVCPETLRTWDARGLLRSTRASNGYRLFRASDVEALRREREERRPRGRREAVR